MNKVPPRDGYGNALLYLAEHDDRLVALDADVAKSTRSNWLAARYPERFINMGISEQDMVGTAAGLALSGMLPFAATYAVFLSGRAFDQIRTTVCYGDLNVKLAGAHAGISVGPDGATHQALEDVALMRTLPNMTVVVPCDALETEKATLALAEHPGPAYIRFGREATPLITGPETPFTLGKARLVSDGTDLVIFANGALVYQAMLAAQVLADRQISAMVVDLHTVKPLDVGFIYAAAQATRAVVTAEEHQRNGGMGSAVCEALAQRCPCPVIRVGVDDSFGESGEPEALMARYGLDAAHIVAAAQRALALKGGQ
ncbi:transketolase family protein [Edwardsiella ictaluri]|uniref:transketolase family protein n=1 Tax=Edwardsiella ictaluri TaxID=67780 RepID=UPI0037834553